MEFDNFHPVASEYDLMLKINEDQISIQNTQIIKDQCYYLAINTQINKMIKARNFISNVKCQYK